MKNPNQRLLWLLPKETASKILQPKRQKTPQYSVTPWTVDVISDFSFRAADVGTGFSFSSRLSMATIQLP